MRIRMVLLTVASVACASPNGATRVNQEPWRPRLTLGRNEAGATAAALQAVIALLPPDKAAVCVTLSGPPPTYWYSPDAALLRKIRSRG